MPVVQLTPGVLIISINGSEIKVDKVTEGTPTGVTTTTLFDSPTDFTGAISVLQNEIFKAKT